MRRLMRLPRILHGAVLRANRHDSLNLAQSTAYSAMVSLFPALIVAAAVVSLLPDNAPLRFQLSLFFDRILPPDVSPLLQSYFVETHSNRPTRALIAAFVVSLIGASSVIATLMEGVRRANELPADCWTFFQRRSRAFLLIPLSLLPFAVATVLLVFGQFITTWLAVYIFPEVQTSIYAVSLIIRWGVALTASVGIIGLIYHLGSPMQQSWKRVLPGAFLATATWFLTTLAFGWYVTRFANYSQVYGSLGAGIALLFWLYIISLCILYGAEFNAEFHARVTRAHTIRSTPSPPNTLPPV
jgi:membrane protein